jgi:hypothetical protein
VYPAPISRRSSLSSYRLYLSWLMILSLALCNSCRWDIVPNESERRLRIAIHNDGNKSVVLCFTWHLGGSWLSKIRNFNTIDDKAAKFR